MTDSPSKRNIPSTLDLLNPTVDGIRQLGGSASIGEITDKVIEILNLPPDIVQLQHGQGRQTELEYRLGWSRTWLKKYGLIDNSERGVWSFTAAGQDTRSVDRKRFMSFMSLVRRSNQSEQQNKSGGKDQTDNTEEFIEDLPAEAASWREAVMDALLAMKPDAFERLCQRLLRESGFVEVDVTGKSGDGGIDGHGIIRLAGLVGFPVVFQCKRYANNVGAKVIRDFRGAMQGRAEKGLILTTASFTREARNEATREGAPPVDLIDGELLLEKLKELGLGIKIKTVEAVEVDRSWFASL